ncbi:MAG: exodeoxyribonuclease VII large subunit [Gemmataceae bacterium]|nr:exodeoxyribonuclease VII large subunit [Gemmataceae bacterium]
MTESALPSQERPLTVSELNATVDELLQEAMPAVWVEGELTKDMRPWGSSGHYYFELKDGGATVSAVMWRAATRNLPPGVQFDKGMSVVVFGHVSIYAPRGQYQIQVQRVLPKGVGAAEEALRRLKEKLLALGFFSPERKRPLPAYPRRVAVVTSASGAAVHDCIKVFQKNWPAHDVVIVPVRVQGEGADRQIADAIRRIGQLQKSEQLECDAVVVGRGGGSSEDLAAFNSELVAQAIFESPVPVISAVGHQIDFSIADLVADHRAATPTEAAELLTQNWSRAESDLIDFRARLPAALLKRVELTRARLSALVNRKSLVRPLEAIHARQQRIDELNQRLTVATLQTIARHRQRVVAMAGRLDALSPLQVLARGYSLTQDESGRLLRDASKVRVGDRLTSRLHRGRVISIATEISDVGGVQE